MNFPKGIRRTAEPKRTEGHRGATWDSWDVILPDGAVVLGDLDTSWGTRFYFFADGAWRRGQIDAFKVEKPSPHFDLRDPRKLAAVEAKLAEYEEAIFADDPDPELIDRLSGEVEDIATAAGFNNHGRLLAMHNMAESVGIAAEKRMAKAS